MPKTTTKLPYFKDMSDDALRENYRAYRNLAYNNAAMAASGAINLSKCATQMGTMMRAIDIIEGLARKRGISLRAVSAGT